MKVGDVIKVLDHDWTVETVDGHSATALRFAEDSTLYRLEFCVDEVDCEPKESS